MAKGVNRQRRGRTIVFLALVGFIAATGITVLRRAKGREMAGEFEALERRRTQLAGEAARLEVELRVAGSRSRLGPLVEQRLGMRIPAADRTIDLPMPAEAARGAP